MTDQLMSARRRSRRPFDRTHRTRLASGCAAATAASAIFKGLGLSAIVVSVGFPRAAALDHRVQGPAGLHLQLRLDPARLRSASITSDPSKIDYDAVVRESLRAQFPDVTERGDRRVLSSLISSGAPILLREQVHRAARRRRQSRALTACRSRISPTSTSRGRSPPRLREEGGNRRYGGRRWRDGDVHRRRRPLRSAAGHHRHPYRRRGRRGAHRGSPVH